MELRKVRVSLWFWIPAALALLFTLGTLYLSLFRPYADLI